MSHFLATKENPDGYKLDDLLTLVRNDLIKRMGRIVDDTRPEARRVLDNDVQILEHLGKAIALAEENSKLLLKSFGPSEPGKPRIGS